MIDTITELLGVSTGVAYALLTVAAVQIAVQIWALVDLARADRVAGGRKWVWAAVILVLSNLALGAILYFAVGKRVPQEAPEREVPAVNGTDRAARAVDALYGPAEGEER